jgi:hypothetical protein
MPKSALPKHLQNRLHEDFPWPFSFIPRAWTAFDWGTPTKIKGTQRPYGGVMKPIGPKGTWQLSKFLDGPWFAYYFAFTTKGGTHWRIGARYDDVDHYTEWPSIARKRGIK